MTTQKPTDSTDDWIQQHILDNPKINVKFIPDALELRVYKTVFVLVQSQLESFCKNATVQIDLFGKPYQIGISLTPVQQPAPASSSSSSTQDVKHEPPNTSVAIEQQHQ